jgi:hypothetical protein
MDQQRLRDEIAHNFDALQRSLGKYLATELNRYAMMRDRAVVAFFDTPSAADLAGAQRFQDGIYSIQQITDEPVEFGIYANAVG